MSKLNFEVNLSNYRPKKVEKLNSVEMYDIRINNLKFNDENLTSLGICCFFNYEIWLTSKLAIKKVAMQSAAGMRKVVKSHRNAVNQYVQCLNPHTI